MSGVEALGVAASILQLLDMSSKLISLTSELKDTSKNGRGTIQSIQTECNTIQSAVLSIKVWEEANGHRPDASAISESQISNRTAQYRPRSPVLGSGDHQDQSPRALALRVE
jgi:hypothetical protein